MDIGQGISLEFLGHSGFMIKNGKTIVIDPFKVPDKIDKADFLLITHSHYDHCSVEDIRKVVKKGTVVITTPDAQSKIMKLEDVEMHLVEPGDVLDFSDVKIETIAAYNKNKEFHPKSEGWVGFIIKMGNVIVYHSGDTDKIPEMSKLSGYGKHGNNFIALLPVSGKYVMDSEQAADVASLISPDLAVPMHYGEIIGSLEDAENFVDLCKQSNIKAEVMKKYG